MKKTHILATLLALLTLAGCEKMDDGVDGMVEIFAESMSGGKVLLDGANSTWVTGDQIRLNGTTATVTRRDDRAYISSDGLADVNRAVYPASLVGSSLTSNTVSIEFPRYYHYRTGDGGQQVLDLPMAAYSTGDNPLQFKHLTGALYITITNTASVPLTLQSVTVTSSNYQLSGTRNIDISTMSIEGSVYNSEDDKSVSLVFDKNLTLSAGSNVRVMVPVLPVGSNQNFTIKVRSVGEDIANTYMYSRSQTSGGDHSLQRNQLGYVPVSITADASSSPLDQVNGAYVVRTPLEFCLMAQGITNSSIANNATIEIMEDINMSGYTVSPIVKTGFCGTIHGNNKIISNLTVGCVNCYPGQYTCALFGYVGNPKISNLNLDRLTLDYHGVGRGALYMGGLIGKQSDVDGGTAIIDGCDIHIVSILVGAPSQPVYFGGVIAEVTKNVTISNCNISFRGISSALTGTALYFGGFVGTSGIDTIKIISSSLVGSHVSMEPSSGSRVGGLVGNMANGFVTATSCRVMDSVSVIGGSYLYCGTLFGFFSGRETKITESDNNLDFKVSFNGNPVAIGRYNTSLTNN